MDNKEEVNSRDCGAETQDVTETPTGDNRVALQQN
jgi:hypothetical protein